MDIVAWQPITHIQYLFFSVSVFFHLSKWEMLYIYKIDEQLSIISEFMTLAPGDILFTGSPSEATLSTGIDG